VTDRPTDAEIGQRIRDALADEHPDLTLEDVVARARTIAPGDTHRAFFDNTGPYTPPHHRLEAVAAAVPALFTVGFGLLICGLLILGVGTAIWWANAPECLWWRCV